MRPSPCSPAWPPSTRSSAPTTPLAGSRPTWRCVPRPGRTTPGKGLPRSWRSDRPSGPGGDPRSVGTQLSGGVGVAPDLFTIDVGHALLRLEAAQRRLPGLRDADLVRLVRAHRELVAIRPPQREPPELPDDGLPVHRDLHRSPELVPREGNVVTLCLPHLKIEIQVPLKH